MSIEHQAWIVATWVRGRPQIAIARLLRIRPGTVNQKISRFCRRSGHDIRWLTGDGRRAAARAILETYLANGGQIEPPEPADAPACPYIHVWGTARREYAAFLRRCGLPRRDIGDRLGVSAHRVDQWVVKQRRIEAQTNFDKPGEGQ